MKVETDIIDSISESERTCYDTMDNVCRDLKN